MAKIKPSDALDNMNRGWFESRNITATVTTFFDHDSGEVQWLVGLYDSAQLHTRGTGAKLLGAGQHRKLDLAMSSAMKAYSPLLPGDW
jgi:hypothetical protein